MANFELIYNELDIGKARSQLADLGWVTLGQMDPVSSVVKMRSEIDRLALDDDTEVNYGGSEHRIWKAHTKSEQMESFRTFSDQVLSEVEGQPFEAFDILAIRNRPIDLENDGVTRGRWHLDSFNRQLKIFMFLTDVDDESGPFEMLPETHKMPFKVKEAIKGNFLSISDFMGKARTYSKLDEKVVRKIVDGGIARKAFTVPAGTICLVDTSCVHRARPCEQGVRYALTSYYR